MYNNKLRFLAGKVESTPGTAVAIAAVTDGNYRVRDCEWTPNVEMEDDKWASGDHAENEAIPGETTADTKIKIKLAAPATMAAVPDWSTWVESCGWKRTAYTTVGQSWVPHTDNDNRTMTQYGLEYEVGAAPQQRAMKFKGAIGNLKIMAEKRSKPINMEMDYKAAWMGPDADIVTASRVLPVTPDVGVSERFTGSTVSIFGATHLAEMFELDTANEISVSGDQADAQSTGIGHFWISYRKPRLKIQVPIQRVSGFDPSTAWKNGTVGVVVITISANFKITVPRGQIVESKPINVNNKMFWDLTFKCLRNGTTDATMDAQACVELLLGAKA